MFNRLFASRNRPCFANPSRWDNLVYDLSGNRLEISLPPQDYDFPEEDNGKRFNLFHSGFYNYHPAPGTDSHPSHERGISKQPVFRRNWDTYGPVWQTDPIGKLQCAGVICDTSRLPGKLNCFNPKQMEQLIIHELFHSLGPGVGSGRNEFRAPINWHIKKHGGFEWIYYESWPSQPAWLNDKRFHFGSDFVAWLAAPLFVDKYVLLSMSANGSFPAEPSNQTMKRRIEQIIPTIKLTLSPEAQKQRAEAQQRFPNAKYSTTRSPELWKYYEHYREGDYAKGEPEHIFEGPGSPPPPLF